MLSYVYMKILETSPSRYDHGLWLLSLGHSDRVKKRIAGEIVERGSRVYELGCGTGALAILAARKGAHVVGQDISASMLKVARNKVEASNLQGQIALVEAGVSGMDKLPPDSFDLFVSTLVFSELSDDERAYALRQAMRILKQGGRLVMADETAPKSFVLRVIRAVTWAPVALVAFILTQTTTHAVAGLGVSIRQAGFSIELEELSRMQDFIYIVARKEAKP